MFVNLKREIYQTKESVTKIGHKREMCEKCAEICKHKVITKTCTCKIVKMCQIAQSGPSADTQHNTRNVEDLYLNVVQKCAKCAKLVPEVGPSAHKFAQFCALLEKDSNEVQSCFFNTYILRNLGCAICVHIWPKHRRITFADAKWYVMQHVVVSGCYR